MIPPTGETLKITPTESVEIISSGGNALLLEATYLPGGPPPKHFHPDQDEHFEVLSGEVRMVRSGAVAATGPSRSDKPLYLVRGVTPHATLF